jgi:DNA-binding transcriptional regulator LsrR (DeoR family)
MTTMNNETDIQVVDATPDAENQQMHMIAKLGAQVLTKHYPDHIWMVGWAPGMTLIVKNMAIEDGRYGFTVDAARAATVSELEHEIMTAGGELLERCGVRRGAWDGEMMTLQNKEY